MKKKFFCILVVLLMAVCLHAQTAINQSSISSFPYVISLPGSYILTSDIYVPAGDNGINIGVSNVTLNMNGYTVLGPMVCTSSSCTTNSGAYGVYAAGEVSNTTIQNGVVRGFNVCAEVASGSLQDLKISSCYEGLLATNAVVKRNVISSSVIAMDLNYTTASDNVVSSCYEGIISSGSSLLNNSVSSSVTWGMYLWSGYAAGNSLINNGDDLGYASVAVASSNNACTNGAC